MDVKGGGKDGRGIRQDRMGKEKKEKSKEGGKKGPKYPT